MKTKCEPCQEFAFLRQKLDQSHISSQCILTIEIRPLTQSITEIILLSINKCDIFNICNDIKKGKQIQKELLFATFTYPFHAITYCMESKKKKKKGNYTEYPLVMYFVLNSIKGMPGAKKLGYTANNYHNAVNMVIDTLSDHLQNNQQKSLQIGRFLMECKTNWIYVLYLVRAVCTVYNKGINKD